VSLCKGLERASFSYSLGQTSANVQEITGHVAMENHRRWRGKKGQRVGVLGDGASRRDYYPHSQREATKTNAVANAEKRPRKEWSRNQPNGPHTYSKVWEYAKNFKQHNATWCGGFANAPSRRRQSGYADRPQPRRPASRTYGGARVMWKLRSVRFRE